MCSRVLSLRTGGGSAMGDRSCVSRPSRVDGFDPKFFEDDGQSSHGDLTRLRLTVVPLFESQITGNLEIKNQCFQLSAPLMNGFGRQHVTTLLVANRAVARPYARATFPTPDHLSVRFSYFTEATVTVVPLTSPRTSAVFPARASSFIFAASSALRV